MIFGRGNAAVIDQHRTASVDHLLSRVSIKVSEVAALSHVADEHVSAAVKSRHGPNDDGCSGWRRARTSGRFALRQQMFCMMRFAVYLVDNKFFMLLKRVG